MKRHTYIVCILLGLCAAGLFYGLKGRFLPDEAGVDDPVRSPDSSRPLDALHAHHCAGGSLAVRDEKNAGPPLTLSAVPVSRLREQMRALPDHLQQEALRYLGSHPALLSDLASVRVGPTGRFYFVCTLGINKAIPRGEIAPQPRVAAAQALGASVAIGNPPIRHSRPGSSKVLYLDFNGGIVTDTAWNEDPDFGLVESWECRPYDTDNNEASFSASEQADIIEIWERVAEDYAAFDVDVTTEAPLLWTDTTGHALITPDTDKNGKRCPHYGLGGLAYVDIFGEDGNRFYSPAWVLDYDDSNAPASFLAEATSHELGHNLALYHDGTTFEEYYEGHSEGEAPSWGPIMGAGYDGNITQWSKGDYYQSDEGQDDLAILSDTLGYRPDDVGDNNGTAASLGLVDGETISQDGVIERTGDPDVFYFITLEGEITVHADPYRAASGTWGGNLDLELRLYNEAGELLASDNPGSEASASIVQFVQAGKYYVHIIPVGAGNPMSSSPSGYTSYASLGQYFMSGRISGDGDGDDLPTYWEELYFSSADLYGALDDPDQDGSDNYSEYIAGTLPNNAASVFAVTNASAIFPAGSPYILKWSTVEGRIYSVGYTPNLQYTTFEVFPDGSNLSHAVNSYTDSVDRAESQGFYRVDVQLAP